jgi:hypothetical protein
MKPLSKGCVIAVIVLVVVAALLTAAGFIFGPRLKVLAHEQVLQFLHNEGLYVEYQTKYGRLDGSVTLVNIVAYETSAKQKPVASLDHLIIRIGLRSLFRDQSLRTYLSTKNAKFTVFGDAPADQVAFENLNLRFDCRPGSVILDHLAAQFLGVDLRAKGDVQIDRGTGPSTAGSRAVPSGQPAAPATLPTTRLDLSPILHLAPAFDYRKASWKPEIEATVHGVHSTVRDSTWDVQVQSSSFPSKNINLDFTGRVVTGKNGNTVIEKAQLNHGKTEANVAGTLVRDTDMLEISRFDSNLDWVSLLRDHPAVGGAWNPVSVTQPPQLSGSGSHHLKKPELSHLTFSLGNFALRYQVKDQKLVTVQQLTTQGLLDKGVLRLTPFNASLAKGSASGEFTYTPFVETPAWSTNLKGTHLYLPDLVAPKDGKELVGYVDFTFAGQGAKKPEALQGQGNFSITNGDFFHTRVFGPLLLFLHKLSNNPEKGKAQELRASFTIQNGVVQTKDLAMEISEAHVQAAGTIDLVKETARFEAQAKLRGPLGLSVDLIGEGPLDKVEWRKK